MKILCVIPARIGSTRLPRKMLATINGQAIIQKTYLAANKCQDFHKVIVATDSDEIATKAREVGAEVILTPTDIQTGSDRVAFVAKELPEYDVIVNLQGDEPFMHPETLSLLIKPFLTDSTVKMSTVGFKLNYEVDYNNPDFVKVIVDKNGDALYFSRAPIPYFRQDRENISNLNVLHHIGLYAYSREFLLEYTTWTPTPLEQAELLEQLRAMENGVRIRVSETPHKTLEINNAKELEQAQRFHTGS